jgi:acetyl esterase/lipase
MRNWRFIRYVTSINLLLLAITLAPAKAALDDGYPAGEPAPGRTCPNSELNAETTSPSNGKIFTCIQIDGAKKWWIKGEPLPTSQSPSQSPSQSTSAATTAAPLEIVVKHTYLLPASSLAKMKVFNDVRYAKDSPEQRLDIYLPKGSKNPPLMIWTHGGGFVFGDENGMQFDETARLLEVFIKNGIAVASVNYRLATIAKFPVAGQDAKLAIRFLRANAAKFGFNPKKFATGGDSAGAYLALMSAFTGNQPSVFDSPSDPNITTSAEISAVFDLFGNANVMTMAQNKVDHPCANKNDFAYGSDPWWNPWFGGDIRLPNVKADVEAANLYPYLKNLKKIPQVYIFQGTADCSVNQLDSIELAREVSKLKGKSNLYLIPGGTHGGPSVMAEARKQIPELAKYFASLK